MSSDPFDQAPASTAGGAFVRLHQLADGADQVTREYASGDEQKHQTVKTRGRLVLMTPVKVEEVLGDDGKTKNRWSVNTVVLDGETITESVNDNTKERVELPEPLVPNSKTALIEGMYTSAVMLGDQLRQVKKGGMLLGRIGMLKARGKGSAPYVLCEFTEDEATVAREYLAKFHNPFAG